MSTTIRDRGMHHFHQGDKEYVIATSYWAKPIPMRQFDWEATDDQRYEPGEPIGYGTTEREAIDDLMEKLNERED